MTILRLIREILGISSILVIGAVAFLSVVAFIFYVFHLPMEWAAWVGIAGLCFIATFIDSKWKIRFPPAWEKPITFRRGAIASVLGLIWLVAIIVALRRAESSSSNSVGILVGGLGILFLIFGRLESMWNRDSRLPAKHVTVRKSPNYYQ